MKPLLSFLIALGLLSCVACVSDPTAAADAPCRCGTPLGDLEGCAHADCRAGRNNPDNPDNPDCVCGTLEIPAAKGK
jgi:hypothetical protein